MKPDDDCSIDSFGSCVVGVTASRRRRPPETHLITPSPLDTPQLLTWEQRVLVMVLGLEAPLPVSPARVLRWNDRKLAMGISLESALPLAVNKKCRMDGKYEVNKFHNH